MKIREGPPRRPSTLIRIQCDYVTRLFYIFILYKSQTAHRGQSTYRELLKRKRAACCDTPKDKHRARGDMHDMSGMSGLGGMGVAWVVWVGWMVCVV